MTSLPDISTTAETRWFGLGEAPPEVLAWWETCDGPADQQPERRDHYLLSIEGDGLSVKVRQAGLEVKQRQHVYGAVQLSGFIAGLVEGWVKWRFPLQDTESPDLTKGIDGTGWLEVNKARQLRRYRIDAQQVVQVFTDTPSGCEVEFTEIQVAGDSWWTVAFEAFGQGARNHDHLLTVARHLFNETAPPLNAAKSYGYPHWLATLNPKR